jgi:Uma2 family endonuclease
LEVRMGVPQKAVAWITPEEYMALEEKAASKHEDLDGVVYSWQGHVPESMARGSRVHNRIIGNSYVALRQQLRGSPCAIYMTDVRLHVRARNAYFYPDIAITCSTSDQSNALADDAVFRDPCLIVEVLSDSTERFDRGEKFEAYKNIPAFSEYVLISSRASMIEVLRRQDSGEWTVLEHRNGIVELQSVPVVLDIAAVYEDLGFPG